MCSIYIHIPFCKKACYYCDFHFSTSLKQANAMVQAICKEIYLRKDFLKNKKISTIYFGGGTPSLLNYGQMENILNTLQKYFSYSKSLEITLEANPDDLSLEKIKEYKILGINRLSIGVQSFFQEDLQEMNRTHTAFQAHKATEYSKKYFENITIDLIYGFPKMSEKRWRANLQKTFDFEIPHLSCYALTVEEKTPLFSMIKKKKYPFVSEEIAFKHFEILVEETQKKGFIHYEISNFAKPNFFSKHNKTYWNGNFYLGIGPSAHSFDGKKRFWNIANNQKYIKAIQENKVPLSEEKLSKNDLYNELIMLGLRTKEGVSLGIVKEKFGRKYYDYLLEQIPLFLAQKKLITKNNFLKTTQKGKFLIDGIAADLFFVT